MINDMHAIEDPVADYVFMPTKKVILRPGDKPPVERPVLSRASIPSSLKQY